ncbi:hypothetical protein COU94_01910 [Candidatus Shapirobacteria bacterium CG10_big_fil_rev_8_21_14_0_10_38_8]|nr:MAG: hypothetical protein COU94_01910 [Candidatus Shapirobacteria bacterium CG10_big_fil_rev_8_21_14_0_10_38_8]
MQKPLTILDAGFSGDLQITPKIAKELGLKSTNIVRVQIANGQIINVPVALAIVSMEGVKNYIQVLISESAPLLGISFLTKFSYKALVDCKNRKIQLTAIR